MKKQTRSFLTLASVALLVIGCGRVSDAPSRAKDIGLVAANGQQTVIWMENGLVFSKECSDNETALNRFCASGVEPRVTSYAGFFKTLAIGQGVSSAYADYRGLERVTRDMATVEQTLNEPGHTPQELAHAEDRLNQLNDAAFRLGKIARVVRNLSVGQDIVMSEGVNDMYTAITQALTGDMRVWRDRVNNRYWTILARPMNWFDAMEIPRVVDNFGNPSEPLQAGCSQQIGDGWRVPTVSEATTSYAAGLKQLPGIRQANPFWTADDASNSPVASAMAYSVMVPTTQSRPKFQEVFTVCVRSIY